MHACSRLLHFCYPQGTRFAENIVTYVEKRCDVTRKVTFVCFRMIFRHRQQTEMGECRVLDINASILRIYNNYKKCQFCLI